MRKAGPRCNSALPSGRQKPWSLDSTYILPGMESKGDEMLLHKEAMVKLHVAAKGFVLSRGKFPEIWIQQVAVQYGYCSTAWVM